MGTLQRKPRILVVLAHFDDTRNPDGRPNFVPQGVGHAFLAGAFAGDRAEIKLYSEFHSGPLRDEKVFAWPDMLVLTGVTSSFDRMRQLTAYARTKSPGCVIVAGGPAVRNLPVASAAIFDYACDGDIEELIAIAREVFGPEAAADRIHPRFDLLSWKSPVNYVESSRYCNFRCNFCALTGERREYQTYDLGYIEEQIRSYPRRKMLLFVDNNFYGSNRSFFLKKLDLLKQLAKERVVPGWIALVTSDFFSDPENVVRAQQAGCLGLFCGVESFNPEQIRAYNKRHNLLMPQVEMIKSCLEAGVVFQYGLIFDPAVQSLDQMTDELEFVLRCDAIPLPAFLSLTIPLLGTPYFLESVRARRFLPLAKLRDMDGFTLLTQPLDKLERVVPFVKGLARLDRRRGVVARHSLGFWHRYRRALSARQMACLIANSVRLCLPNLINNRRALAGAGDEDLTCITTSQPLGPLYRPFFNVSELYRDHFTPTMITDHSGALEPEIEENLSTAAGRSAAQAWKHPPAKEPSAGACIR